MNRSQSNVVAARGKHGKGKSRYGVQDFMQSTGSVSSGWVRPEIYVTQADAYRPQGDSETRR